jgi:methionyl-tRNA synthetase
MEAAEFRKALGELRAIWVAGNEYMTKAAPWTHIKTDRAKAAVGVRMGLNLVHQFAHLTWPVMPTMAVKIHETIQPIAGGPQLIPWPDRPMAQTLDELEAGQPIHSPDVLVAKITDEQVAEWKLKFGGFSAAQ